MNIKDSKIVKWAKRHKVLTGIALVLLVLYIIFSNWIYRGTVLDAATGKPIEGAVVVAKWVSSAPTLAGPSTTVSDVKETLTDKDGNWMMRGSRIGESPQFIIYKPGYCPFPDGKWSIDACKGMYVTKISCDHYGCGETLSLPKLTNREDRLQASRVGPVYGASDEKEKKLLENQKEFIRLLKEEDKYLWP